MNEPSRPSVCAAARMSGLELSDAALRRLIVKAETLTGAMSIKPHVDAVKIARSLFQQYDFPPADQFDGLVAAPWRGRRPSAATTALHGSPPTGIAGGAGRRSSRTEPFSAESRSTPAAGAIQGDSSISCEPATTSVVALSNGAESGDSESNPPDLADFTGLSEPADAGALLVPVIFLLPVEVLRTSPLPDTRVFVLGSFSAQPDCQGERAEMRLVHGFFPVQGALCNLTDPGALSGASAFRADVLIAPGRHTYHFVVELSGQPDEWVVLPTAYALQSQAGPAVSERAALLHPPPLVNCIHVPTPDGSDCTVATAGKPIEGTAVEVRAGPRERSLSSCNWVSDESADESVVDAFSAAFRVQVSGASAPRLPASMITSSQSDTRPGLPVFDGFPSPLVPLQTDSRDAHTSSVLGTSPLRAAAGALVVGPSAVGSSEFYAAAAQHKLTLRDRIASSAQSPHRRPTSPHARPLPALRTGANSSRAASANGKFAASSLAMESSAAVPADSQRVVARGLADGLHGVTVRAVLRMGPAPRGFDPSATSTLAGGRVARRLQVGSAAGREVPVPVDAPVPQAPVRSPKR